MCVICISPSGKQLPSEHTIRNMFSYNNDGAGMMYTKNGNVYIEKGFMTIDSFLEGVETLKRAINTEKETVIFHFRITTAGGTNPKNCHPFPLSDKFEDMQKLKFRTNIGMAHNGIIPIKTSRADVSDTMEFDRQVLHHLWKHHHNFYENDDFMEKIDKQINGSRMVFLLPNRKFYKLGNWIENDEDGLIYSNSSFEDRHYFTNWGYTWPVGRHTYSYNYGYDWDDDYEWYDDNTWDGKTTLLGNIDEAKDDEERSLLERYAEALEANKTIPYTHRMLMPLIDNNCYLVDCKTGYMMECEPWEFMMDADYNIYYDEGIDPKTKKRYASYAGDEIIAFKHNGTQVNFDYKKSILCCID